MFSRYTGYANDWGSPLREIGKRELSRGFLLQRLDGLIGEAAKLSDRSRTTMTGELSDLKNGVRYCLADIGPDAQDALRVIGSIEFLLSPDEAQRKDSEERCYEHLDQLRRILESVRNKIETRQSITPIVNQEATRASKRSKDANRTNPGVPYSEKDRMLYELIGPANLYSLTDAKLWTLYRSAFQKQWPKRNHGAFRDSVYRIRRKHGIRPPKKTA